MKSHWPHKQWSSRSYTSGLVATCLLWTLMKECPPRNAWFNGHEWCQKSCSYRIWHPIPFAVFLLSEQWRLNCCKWAQSSVCERYWMLLISRPVAAFIGPSVHSEPSNRCWPVSQVELARQPMSISDIREGNTNMALTHGPAHNGTPPAIKYDDRSVTSY